jgi:hypothetical protein
VFPIFRLFTAYGYAENYLRIITKSAGSFPHFSSWFDETMIFADKDSWNGDGQGKYRRPSPFNSFQECETTSKIRTILISLACLLAGNHRLPAFHLVDG